MSTMISQTLNTDGSWTLIAEGPIANILLTGVSNGWEVIVADSPPGPTDQGMPITSIDGAWGSTALDETDNVYGRPFGQRSRAPLVIKGMMN